MKKTINNVALAGRVYSFGEKNGRDMLAAKVTGSQSKVPGTPFIQGTVNIAVDEEGLNVIPVKFTYVTEKTKNGNANATYTALNRLLELNKTWIENGKEEAPKITITGAVALNDFYVEENGEDRLVSSKYVNGSFLNIVNTLPTEEVKTNFFETDMVITNVTHIEADEEKDVEEHAIIRGAIFDFRGAILPLDYTVKSASGINFFTNAGISSAEPYFTKVSGNFNCSTIKQTRTEESAFGDAVVKTFEKSVKEWIVNHASSVPYEFGEDTVLTAEELTKAMQDRQVYLADVKKRQDEFKANKNTPSATPTVAPSATKKGFQF